MYEVADWNLTLWTREPGIHSALSMSAYSWKRSRLCQYVLTGVEIFSILIQSFDILAQEGLLDAITRPEIPRNNETGSLVSAHWLNLFVTIVLKNGAQWSKYSGAVKLVCNIRLPISGHSGVARPHLSLTVWELYLFQEEDYEDKSLRQGNLFRHGLCLYKLHWCPLDQERRWLWISQD